MDQQENVSHNGVQYGEIGGRQYEIHTDGTAQRVLSPGEQAGPEVDVTYPHPGGGGFRVAVIYLLLMPFTCTAICFIMTLLTEV